MQRTYALNDEAALVICDYGKAERPRIPFPYYAEAWTGLEYSGRLADDVRRHDRRRASSAFATPARRYDGEKRNPWDEPECGHHYARAMSAWSGTARAQRLPLSRAASAPSPSKLRSDTAASGAPRRPGARSTSPRRRHAHVDHGTLECRTLIVNGKKHSPNATLKEGEDLRV